MTDIRFDPNDTLVSGAISALASGELISGFVPGDTIVLDGYVTTSDDYVSGIGLELNGGGETLRLALPANVLLDVTSDGSRSTITAFLAPVPTIATHGAIDSAAIAEIVTINSAGVVFSLAGDGVAGQSVGDDKLIDAGKIYGADAIAIVAAGPYSGTAPINDLVVQGGGGFGGIGVDFYRGTRLGTGVVSGGASDDLAVIAGTATQPAVALPETAATDTITLEADPVGNGPAAPLADDVKTSGAAANVVLATGLATDLTTAGDGTGDALASSDTATDSGSAGQIAGTTVDKVGTTNGSETISAISKSPDSVAASSDLLVASSGDVSALADFAPAPDLMPTPAPPPPGIHVGEAEAFVAVGEATSITGISLTVAGSSAGETFKVQLSDADGLLFATGAGVSGAGTEALTLTGSLARINADLMTLTDTDPTAGTDRIIVKATGSYGGTARSAKIAVTAGSIVTPGAPVAVDAGTPTVNPVIGDGACLILSPDATATGATVSNGGVLAIAPGAAAAQTVIDNSVAEVFGSSSDTTILDDGYELVGNSGQSNGTVIRHGGYQYVLDGGAAFNTTLTTGGIMLLGEGGEALGGIDFAGSNAVLSIAGDSMPGAVIGGFNQAGASNDAIILTGFTYAAGRDTATLNSSGILTADLGGDIEKLTFNRSESNAGHRFAVTTNSLDQVVIIDPVIATSQSMDFLASATAAGSTNIMQQILGRSAGFSADYSEKAASAAFLTAVKNVAAIATLDTPGSPAASASLASLNLPSSVVALIDKLTAHG